MLKHEKPSIWNGYRSFVWNVIVQIPKFDAKPNPNSNPNPSPSRSPNPNPMPIRFGQMTLRTSELLPWGAHEDKAAQEILLAFKTYLLSY